MSDVEIRDFLVAQRVGRLGCHAGGVTYVVPVIFAWNDEGIYVYTTEGLKVSMMRENPEVCFEVDEYLANGSWRSVIVQGVYEELHGPDVDLALALLTQRVARRAAVERETDDRGEGRVPVALRIRTSEVTGRKVDRNA